MRIDSVAHNNRRRGFTVVANSSSHWFPYAKLPEKLRRNDHVVATWVDAELGNEGFSYRFSSGAEGAVHVDAVLAYNRDPTYVREMLLHKLTLAAREQLEGSGLSRREVIRLLGTSPAQLYRLLDTTNCRKSVDQMVKLLTVLDCDVELVVSSPSPASVR